MDSAVDTLKIEFTKATGISLPDGVMGRDCTTLAIGGSLRFFVECNSVEEVCASVRFFNLHKLSYRILGAGSNLLISDSGVDEAIIMLGRGFRSFEERAGGYFYVGGAVKLMPLCRTLSDAGYAGLEFAGGIPGSFGGAVRMNAGAHGGETFPLIKTVHTVASDGSLQMLNSADLTFSYRRNSIPHDSVIIGAEIQLVRSDPEKTKALRAKFLQFRKDHQPLSSPSAGSVFKNPQPDQSAGFLIESVGLKGFSIGDVQISPMHANWIVNPKKTGSSEDAESLIERCKVDVKERYGIKLEQEIISWK